MQLKLPEEISNNEKGHTENGETNRSKRKL